MCCFVRSTMQYFRSVSVKGFLLLTVVLLDPFAISVKYKIKLNSCLRLLVSFFFFINFLYIPVPNLNIETIAVYPKQL